MSSLVLPTFPWVGDRLWSAREDDHDGTYEVISGGAGSERGSSDPSGTPGPIFPTDVFSWDYGYTTVNIDGRYINITVLNQFNQTVDTLQFFDNSGASNSTITNNTDITTQGSTGILASSGNTIVNNASISNVYTGIDATFSNNITNNGIISFTPGGNGIHVYDNNTILNTGMAEASRSRLLMVCCTWPALACCCTGRGRWRSTFGRGVTTLETLLGSGGWVGSGSGGSSGASSGGCSSTSSAAAIACCPLTCCPVTMLAH